MRRSFGVVGNKVHSNSIQFSKIIFRVKQKHRKKNFKFRVKQIHKKNSNSGENKCMVFVVNI